MNYTKNIGLKLRNRGFKFSYSMDLEETDLKIEVYAFNEIEVNIDHEQKKIDFEYCSKTEYLPIKGVQTLNDLMKLKKLMYNQ